MYKKYRFDIEGMNCPSCSYRLQKHLKKLDGVKEVSVNLASASLSIEFDNEKVSLKKIEEEVREMGYRLITGNPSSGLRRTYERRMKRKELKSRSQGKRLTVALIFLVPLLLAGLSPLLHYDLPTSFGFEQHPGHFALFELFLSVPILLAGWRYIQDGWLKLIQLRPNINSLAALGVTASLLYSLYSSYFLIWEEKLLSQYPLYYLPACAIIAMIMLGRYVESKITAQSELDLQKLTDLLPETALQIANNQETEISINELQPGDLVKISPATYIPVDGIVKKGMSMVEESVFTGNKTPVLRAPDDKVLAGMLNQEGYLTVEVQKKGDDTFLAETIRLIEEGANSRPAISWLADRTSSWVIQGVLAIALLAAGLWIIFTHNYPFALNIFISVLVIACPVAIGLAIPISVLFASQRASSLGFLIRHISAFESLKRSSTYVFNLTGTITKGRPVLTDIIANQKLSSDELLRLAVSAEAASDHPIASAIRSEARGKAISLTHPDPIRELPGLGIEAVIDDVRVDIGNRKLMELIQADPELLDQMSAICRDLSSQGKSAVMIAVDGQLEGIIAVVDKPRAEARMVIEKLQQAGNQVILLTGEHWATARYMAHEVGITEVHAEVQSSNRARFIRKLQHEGKLVVMIGDGINDAGALAQADAGIAIGSPDDIAADAADIVLLNKDLRLLLTVIRFASKTIRNMKENLFFAFLYNLLMVPIAAGVLYLFDNQLLLNPVFAVTAMFLGSLSVLLNGLRLKRFK